MKKKQIIKLPKEDIKIFEEAIENPPKPNNKLKEAFKRYKKFQKG